MSNNCFYYQQSTLENYPYVCFIDFFPPKINVKFQVNGICHKVFTYLAHIVLWFERNQMTSFLLNQDFPFLSPTKNSIYEVKLLKRKAA